MQRLGEQYNRYKNLDNVIESNIYETYNGNVSDINTDKNYSNDYIKSFNPEYNNQLSVSQEPNIEYETTIHDLVVTSKSRNLLSYPSSSHYVINLSKEYKNIKSISLVQAIIPDQNAVTNEPYLLLKVDELNNNMDCNDKNISDAFAIIQLTPATVSGTFIQNDNRIHEKSVLYFKTPKAQLSKMTITITDSDGIPFNFGGNNTLTKAYQNVFTFRIVTEEKNRRILQNRAVF